MKPVHLAVSPLIFLFILSGAVAQTDLTYPVVDPGQEHCYDERSPIEFPAEGEPFYGQAAQFKANPPSYRDNEDGTVSDLVTNLMWTQDPGEKMTLAQALAQASECRVGGYDDWRLSTIKELYSLILFSGQDPDPNAADSGGLKPFLDTSVFTGFQYGNVEEGALRFTWLSDAPAVSWAKRIRPVRNCWTCMEPGPSAAIPKWATPHGFPPGRGRREM